MLFIVLMFQAWSFWMAVMPLSLGCEICLIWGRYRFGIRARLRFSLWDMDYGFKILRKLVSEE